MKVWRESFCQKWKYINQNKWNLITKVSGDDFLHYSTHHYNIKKRKDECILGYVKRCYNLIQMNRFPENVP